MGKNVRVGLMGLFFATLLVATRMVEQSNKPTGKFADEFGETIGEAIDKGFFFYDGKYIESPYSVSRRGIELYINDCKLSYKIVSTWPPPKEDDQIPPLPKGLTAESSFKDLETSTDPMDRHDRKMIRYLMRHYEYNEVYDRIVEYYKGLPFVKDAVEEEPKRSGKIRVETKKGEVVLMGLPYSRPVSLTKEYVRESLEKKKGYYESRLRSGNSLFLFSNGGCEISIERQGTIENLGKISKVLQSGEALAKKKEILESLGIPPVGKPTDMIMSNFNHSEQLETRLKALEAERTENIPLPLPPEENKGPSDFEKWQQLQKEIRERFDKK